MTEQTKNETVDIIELIFNVTANVASDGDDIVPYFKQGTADGMSNNADAAVMPAFLSATVNRLPEPTTGLLFSLGLAAALRSRKRRA